MQYEVEVNYRGQRAVYNLKLEGTNIFQAELARYDGVGRPPQEILLFKGIRRWIGSSDDPSLLNQLGNSIEAMFTNSDFQYGDGFSFDYESRRSNDQGSPDAYPNRK